MIAIVFENSYQKVQTSILMFRIMWIAFEYVCLFTYVSSSPYSHHSSTNSCHVLTISPVLPHPPSVTAEGEVLVKFALQFKKLEDAVAAVIDFLGDKYYCIECHVVMNREEWIMNTLSCADSRQPLLLPFVLHHRTHSLFSSPNTHPHTHTHVLYRHESSWRYRSRPSCRCVQAHAHTTSIWYVPSPYLIPPHRITYLHILSYLILSYFSSHLASPALIIAPTSVATVTHQTLDTSHVHALLFSCAYSSVWQFFKYDIKHYHPLCICEWNILNEMLFLNLTN